MGKKNSEIKISTLLGADCEIRGDFQTEGSARIDGSVFGNCIITGSLILGAGGKITGSISARSVIIGGEVLGNIDVSEKAELTDTARVFGDISTNVIVIDENAIFQGKCNMNQETPEGVSRHPSLRTLRAGRKSAKAVLAEAMKEVEEAEHRSEETEVNEAAE